MLKSIVSRVMREMGRKGGKARLQTMTPEERSEIARKAGLAGGRGRPKKAVKERTKGRAKPK